MNGTDSILKKFFEAEQPAEMEKEAAAQTQADAVTRLFLNSCAAAGWNEEGLSKFASENPQKYKEMFNDWLVAANEELAEQQKTAALEKQAEAQYMQKMAEDVLSGRVMAYAFVDELGQIFQHLQKTAEEGEKKDLPPWLQGKGEEKKEEGGEKKDEEKKETPAEEKKEEKAEEKKEDEKKDEEKKEGSVLPLKVQVLKTAIEKAASAGYQPTKEEIDFLATCKVAESGMQINWPAQLK
jgi:hypothetical protein